MRAEFRRILMGMGFEEMPTNRWVESSFWNFDALFQPQSHPARDAHDTFFIKDPAETLTVPPDYYERVKQTHQVTRSFVGTVHSGKLVCVEPGAPAGLGSATTTALRAGLRTPLSSRVRPCVVCVCFGIARLQQVGGYGSIGYRTVFEEKEARKNLLRTHTTAISAQMLYKLANQEGAVSPVPASFLSCIE